MASTTNITSSYAGKASEFYIKSLFGGKTLATKGIDIDSDVPYKKALRGFDLTNLIQTGATCSWNDVGTTSITEQVLDVKPHFVNITYCDKDFKTSWNYEKDTDIPNDVKSAVEEMVKSNIQADIEGKVWKANLTGGTNYTLAQFNGFVRQIRLGSPIVQAGVTALTSTNIATELGKVLSKLPDAITDKDPSEVVIFVSKKAETAYKLNLAAQGTLTTNGEKQLDFLGYEVRGVNLPDNVMVAGLRASFHIISNVGLEDASFNMKNMYPVTLEKNIRVEGSYSYNVGVTNIPQIVIYG